MQQARPARVPAIRILLVVWMATGVGGDLAFSSAVRPVPLLGPGSAIHRLEGELCGLEQRLFADAADGKLDSHRLLGAALVASGVNDARRLRHYEMQVADWVAELRVSRKVSGSPQEKARAIFEFMHGRILHGGYLFDCTDLTVALDRGYFNCVSASVLFNCLAERFGLPARGLEAPGHATSRLILPEGTLDVETTCPSWFRLMNDPKRQRELVEQTTGYRRPEGGLPADCREVSGVELVATIYYNRGVDLLGRKQFAPAVAANAKALRLDPSSATARGNLLATLNNWAIALGSDGHYARAVELLRQGLALDATYKTFTVNYVHVHHQWVEHLWGGERFEAALEVLAEAQRQYPGQSYFPKARLDVYRRWAAFARGRGDQATQERISRRALDDPLLGGQAAAAMPDPSQDDER